MPNDPDQEDFRERMELLQRRLRRMQQLESERAKLLARGFQNHKLTSLAWMCSHLAHDLNNMLLGVLGNASLGRQLLEPGAEVGEQLDKIERSARRASDLMKRLLEFSNGGKLSLGEVDLSKLVNKALEEVRQEWGLPFRLTLAIQPEIEPVEVDPFQIIRVVVQLVRNALQAGSSAVELQASTLQASRLDLARAVVDDRLPAGMYTRLVVSDHGCGMDELTGTKAFDPFFSTSADRKGLGLSVSLGIVRAHYGAIRFSSQPGVGTTFELLLPHRQTRKIARDQARRLTRKIEERERPGRVLLLEPDASDRMLTRACLESVGLVTLCAENEQEALYLMQQCQRPLAGAWLGCDDASGVIDFAREIRQQFPQTAIVVAGAHGDQAVQSALSNQGLIAMLQKPLVPDELTEAVERLLGIDPDRSAE